MTVEITMEEAVNLVGFDAATEAANGEAQLLDTGAKLIGRGGRFFISGYAWDESDIAVFIERKNDKTLGELKPLGWGS